MLLPWVRIRTPSCYMPGQQVLTYGMYVVLSSATLPRGLGIRLWSEILSIPDAMAMSEPHHVIFGPARRRWHAGSLHTLLYLPGGHFRPRRHPYATIPRLFVQTCNYHHTLPGTGRADGSDRLISLTSGPSGQKRRFHGPEEQGCYVPCALAG